MTHILIPRTPTQALLRPFIECPTPELDQAWAAMVRIAEVQHARDGRGCLAQIEEPAQPVLYVSPEQLAKHSNPEGPESAEAGRYLPARVTPAGKFIQPLDAGAAPAAVAGPAWDKTRDSLATLLLGLARRPFLDFDVACIALDAATEPGMPLAYMRSAAAAPTLEARASDLRNAATQALADLERAAGHISSAVALRAALEAPAAPGTPPLTPDEARWAARSADRMRGPSDVTSGAEYAMAGAMALAKKLAAAPQAPAAPAAFQQRVQPWLMECFGPAISADKQERNHRFLEEALETVQAGGCTASEAHQLVDYVFGRPVGELGQEVGGAMTTLAALCLANGIDMHAEAEKELARVWTMVEKIRAKQAAKPKHSPLPAAPAAPAPAPLADHTAYAVIDSMGWALDDQEKDDMLALLRAYEKRQGIAAQAKEGGA